MAFVPPLLVGAAATTFAATGVTVAATTGLIGTAGAVTVSGVLAAGAAGAAIAGGISAAQAARQQGLTSQAIAEFDAQRAEQEATERERAGAVAASELRKRNIKLLSSLRAAFGKAGVRAAGSPLLVQLETAELGAADVATLQRDIRIGAGRFRSQAELLRVRGTSARRTGRLRAGQALFRGGAQGIGILANRFV